MTLSEVRTTIRDRLIALQYNEFKEFNAESVPNPTLENAFHVKVTGGSGNPINHGGMRIPCDVILTIWKKGFANPVESEDAGLASMQEILCDLTSPEVRLAPSYRRIDFNSFTMDQIAADNEHICKVVMNFTVEVLLEVRMSID